MKIKSALGAYSVGVATVAGCSTSILETPMSDTEIHNAMEYLETQYAVDVGSFITDDPENPFNPLKGASSTKATVEHMDGTKEIVIVESLNGSDGLPVIDAVPTRVEYVTEKVEEKYGVEILVDDEAYPLTGISRATVTVAGVNDSNKEELYVLTVSNADLEPTLLKTVEAERK